MLLLLLYVIGASSLSLNLSIKERTKTDTLRIDLLVTPLSSLVHPEIVKVIACTGKSKSCNGPNMIERILYEKDKHQPLIEIKDRMLFIPRQSIPQFSGPNVYQYVKIVAKLKHADGTLALDNVSDEIDINLESNGPKDIIVPVTSQNGLQWYAYTGMGLGIICMLGIVGLIGLQVTSWIIKRKNRPTVAYGSVYNFNDGDNKIISKKEKEKQEDLELAIKLGYY